MGRLQCKRSVRLPPLRPFRAAVWAVPLSVEGCTRRSEVIRWAACAGPARPRCPLPVFGPTGRASLPRSRPCTLFPMSPVDIINQCLGGRLLGDSSLFCAFCALIFSALGVNDSPPLALVDAVGALSFRWDTARCKRRASSLGRVAMGQLARSLERHMMTMRYQAGGGDLNFTKLRMSQRPSRLTGIPTRVCRDRAGCSTSRTLRSVSCVSPMMTSPIHCVAT